MKTITPEEVGKLPIYTVMIGNEQRRIRYDEKTKTVYRLHPDGTWTGKHTVFDLTDQIKAIQAKKMLHPEGKSKCQPPVKRQSSHQAPEEEIDVPEMHPLPILERTQQEPPAVFQKVETAPKPESAAPQKNPMPSTHKEGEITSEEIDEFVEGQSEDQKDSHQRPKRAKKRRLKLYFVLIAIGLCSILFISLWFAVESKLVPKDNDIVPSTSAISDTQTDPEDTSSTETPTAPVNDTGTEPEVQETAIASSESEHTYIHVLAPMESIIPGQAITAEALSIVQIEEATYLQLTTFGGLYTHIDLEQLHGFVAAQYIPAGKYLTYNDITKSYDPLIPWEDISETSLQLAVAMAPTDIFDYSWGNHIDVTIKVTTKTTDRNNVNQDDEQAMEGIEHESSVIEAMVIDTYKLQNIQILDILDSSGDSLFSQYMAMAAIPSALQKDYLEENYTDLATLQKVIPAYIVVGLTAEQASQLTELDQNNMTLQITDAKPSVETPLQNEVYAKIHDIQSAIGDTWAAMQEEGAVSE